MIYVKGDIFLLISVTDGEKLDDSSDNDKDDDKEESGSGDSVQENEESDGKKFELLSDAIFVKGLQQY